MHAGVLTMTLLRLPTISSAGQLSCTEKDVCGYAAIETRADGGHVIWLYQAALWIVAARADTRHGSPHDPDPSEPDVVIRAHR
jgi:hypothetical protein